MLMTTAALLAAGIGAGGSIAGGALANRKTSAQKQLEAATLARENLVRPAGESAIGFYQKLLSGDRNTSMSVLAPTIQNVTAQYETTKKNIMASMPAGGVRDKALAEIEAGKVRDIGNLFTTTQPMAAEALGNIFTGSQNISGLQTAANLSVQQQQGAASSGAAIGQALSKILFGQKGTTTPNIPIPGAPGQGTDPFVGSFNLGF